MINYFRYIGNVKGSQKGNTNKEINLLSTNMTSKLLFNMSINNHLLCLHKQPYHTFDTKILLIEGNTCRNINKSGINL